MRRVLLLRTRSLRLPNSTIGLRHQSFITATLQPRFPMLPPLLVESSPLLSLHRLALLRNLALEFLAFAGQTPQRGRSVSEPGCCGFQGSLVGLLLLIVVVFESHADGPDGVERKVVVG